MNTPATSLSETAPRPPKALSLSNGPKRRLFLQAAALAAAACWAFWPALRGGWVWDDFTEIVRNPILRDPAGLRKIWFAPAGADYFPLKTSLQWIEWRCWGAHPLGYHLVSLGLHILSALLLWGLLRKLGAGPRGAWLGGLLFAVHPLTVESVAWISEFKNTLSLSILLLAMLAYLKYDRIFTGRSGRSGRIPSEPFLQEGREDREGRHSGGLFIPDPANTTPAVLPDLPDLSVKKTTAQQLLPDLPDLPVKKNNSTTAASRPSRSSCKNWYFASFLLFVLAMLSKASVVMFPVVILLHAWWKRGRVGRRDWLASAPFFAVSLALGLVTLSFQERRAMGGTDVVARGLAARVGAAGHAVLFYFGKAILPLHLIPNYPLWPPSHAALAWMPWLVLAAAGIVLHRFAPGAKGRAALFGLGFFLANLIPVLGLFPMAYLRISWVADHFAYLPLLGLVGLAAAAAGRSRAGTAAALAVAAAFAIGSRDYARVFAGDEALWGYTVFRNPGSWTAQNDLGMALASQGRTPEAIDRYEEALRLNPEYTAAHINLGNALAASDRLSEAEAQYAAALKLEPRSVEARVDLGNALAQSGNYTSAIDEYEQAVKTDPGFDEGYSDLAYAHYKLGNALGNAGRIADAIGQYRTAIRYRAAYPEAHANLGLALATAGRYTEAVAELREALRLRPAYAEAEAYLGYALAGAGQLDASIEHYRRALELNPADADVRYNLAEALRRAGRNAEADALVAEAQRLQRAER